MTEIPDDIRAAAFACIPQYAVEGVPESGVSRISIHEARSRVAAAILAERKRCADVARGGVQKDGSFIFTIEGEAIAEAIEAGT